MRVQITQSELDGYTNDINNISDEAARVAKNAYLDWRKQNPLASVEEVREYIKALVESLVASYGMAVSEVAAENYDAMADAAGFDHKAADTIDISDKTLEVIDKKARYFVRHLVPDREDI